MHIQTISCVLAYWLANEYWKLHSDREHNVHNWNSGDILLRVSWFWCGLDLALVTNQFLHFTKQYGGIRKILNYVWARSQGAQQCANNRWWAWITEAHHYPIKWAQLIHKYCLIILFLLLTHTILLNVVTPTAIGRTVFWNMNIMFKYFIIGWM